jgi:hypothetical protein
MEAGTNPNECLRETFQILSMYIHNKASILPDPQYGTVLNNWLSQLGRNGLSAQKVMAFFMSEVEEFADEMKNLPEGDSMEPIQAGGMEVCFFCKFI